jgi:ABC-2 type transport system ATP-binding protein
MDIEIKGLTKIYVSIAALQDVHLTVERGESVGLLGSNGAGKTTLLHILMGFTSFDRGMVKLLGRPSASLDAATKEQVGFISEEIGVLPWASLWDLSALYRQLYHNWDEELFDRYVQEWQLMAEKPMRALSKGQQRLAELALCFSCHPRALLMDEPFSGLDAVMRIEVLRELQQMRRRAEVTILCTSHILTDVEKLVERAVILRLGRVCLDQALSQLGSPLEEVFMRYYRRPTESWPARG